MAAPLTRHSRWVHRLKVVLPIAALAILSTIFLFAHKPDYEGLLPHAEGDLQSLASDPRLSDAQYSGLTSDGASVSVTAATVRPGATAADPLDATDIRAIYRKDNRPTMTAEGNKGTLDQAAGLLTLTGLARLTTADGYVLTSERMSTSIRDTDLAAEGSVIGTGPFGLITAGAMTLKGPPGQQQLVFKGGVKVIYTPTN